MGSVKLRWQPPFVLLASPAPEPASTRALPEQEQADCIERATLETAAETLIGQIEQVEEPVWGWSGNAADSARVLLVNAAETALYDNLEAQ